MVRAGDVVVTTGQLIDQQTFQILRSLRDQIEQQIGYDSRFWVVSLGRFAVVLVILLVNYLFYKRFAGLYFGDGYRHWLFLAGLYLLMTSLTAVAIRLPGVSPYVVPLPIVAIYLMTYCNMRVAIFGNISVALLGALFVGFPFEYFFINFMAGMIAIFMMQHHYHRTNLLQAVGAILATQIVTFICFAILFTGTFTAISFSSLLWFVFSALLLLGFYQAVYLIERVFGFVSDITLLELCDTNQPLLLELAEKAPGTFQHSVQVANLAEAAAKEVGANPLLARTGAMYHDIGKMENPFCFVENLSGVFNPHEDITPIESAQIILRHVTDGVAIARRNAIPNQVVEFITGHHGTSLIYFFYARQQAQDSEFSDRELFCYPGPRPVSREVAICMMADAIEAASRSLKSYDSEQLEELVDKVIDIQIQDKQFSDSELSFREVEQIKALFKTKLNTIYHGRITYPERK